MIDTTALTALITAFRAEVTQNSISPEKVGSILQQIADLLATAAPDSDISEFTVLRQRLMGVSTMFTSLAQGTSDRNHIYLTSNTYNVATGTKHTNTDAIRIQQATTERAGAMRAQQVIDLNAAKKNITELQDEIANLGRVLDATGSHFNILSEQLYGIKNTDLVTLSKNITDLQTEVANLGRVLEATGSRFNILSEQIDGIKNTDIVTLSENIADLHSLLETLDTEMGEAEDDIIVLRNDISDIQDIRTISVDVKDRFLILQGAAPLLERKLVPYLFRLTKKANRKRYKNSAGVKIRKKNRPRKGWHLMGNRTTLNVDATTLEVSINTTVHGNDKREASYSYHPMDFIKLSNDIDGHKQVAYGKRLISLWNEEKERERKVSLKYGIAFGYKTTGDGLPIDLLCTNIAEFSVVYDPKSRSWSFSK
ncbi:MAG: hypothetical protein IKT53_06050 [Bacteroidaceae bacterium]|nr:hypothetical protein [Bacteroidaceae bacterium]